MLTQREMTELLKNEPDILKLLHITKENFEEQVGITYEEYTVIICDLRYDSSTILCLKRNVNAVTEQKVLHEKAIS